MIHHLFKFFFLSSVFLFCTPCLADELADAIDKHNYVHELTKVEDFANIIDLCHQVEPILAKSDSIDAYGCCINDLLIAYQRIGDFGKAIAYAELCLQIDRSIGDPTSLSVTLNNTATLYAAAGQPEEAERYILEAIEIERTTNDSAALSVRLGLAAEIQTRLGKYDLAVKNAIESIEIEKAAGTRARVAVHQSQLATAYRMMKRFDDARELLEQACVTLEQEEGASNSLGIALNQLGGLSVNQHRYAEATEYLRRARAIFARIGNRYMESNVCHQFYEVYQADPTSISTSEAMEYIARYAMLSDTLYHDKLAEQMQSFNVKYDVAQKQHQLDMQSAEISRHRIWMYVAGIYLLILTFVAVLYGRMALARGAANRVLVQTNLAKDRLLEIAHEEKLQAETARQQILQVAERIGNLGDMPDIDLTARERQLIILYSKGLLSKEIASQLNISVRTVETHKNHIYRKLGINNSVELLRFAQQTGLV